MGRELPEEILSKNEPMTGRVKILPMMGSRLANAITIGKKSLQVVILIFMRGK